MLIRIDGEQIEFTNKMEFDSEEEAAAFREGIHYANDSALSVVGIQEHNGVWTVYLYDVDNTDREDA